MTLETLDSNWMYSDDDLSEGEEEQLGKVLVVDGELGSSEESGMEEEEEEEEEEEDEDEDEAPEPVKIQYAEDEDYDKE